MLALASLSPVRYKTETDPALVNETAEYFFNTFGNAILRLAYSYLHNTDDSEDVLQDTLIRYLQAAPKFENDKHAKAWLMRVAANISKNKLRSNKLRLTDELKKQFDAHDGKAAK